MVRIGRERPWARVLDAASDEPERHGSERSGLVSMSTLDTSREYDYLDVPRPRERFVAIFPARLDKALQPFDDAGIAVAQFVSGTAMYVWHVAVTAVFTIELAIVVPLALFVLGVDALATEFTYLALMATLFSQIPKRFLFRPRPFMVGRARKLRNDVTSSFPSRAVLCATVFGFAICYAYCHEIEQTSLHFEPWMLTLVLGCAGLAAFARMGLGVHYPSDCIAGFAQGLLVCAVATVLYRADIAGCTSCWNDGCYTLETPTSGIEAVSAANLWTSVNVPLVVGFTAAALVLTAAMLVRPLAFWEKGGHVLGVLLPCVLFQLTLLCPPYSPGRASLAPPAHSPAFLSYLFAAALVAVSTGIGMGAKSIARPLRVPAFLFLYLGTFIALVYWRAP